MTKTKNPAEKLNLSQQIDLFLPKIEIGEHTTSPFKLLQAFTKNLDGLNFKRAENLPEGKNFSVAIKKVDENFPTKKVIRGGKWISLSKEDNTERWMKEVEKAKNNPQDQRKNKLKEHDPWKRNHPTIGILVDQSGKEVFPTHEIPTGEIEIEIGSNFSYADLPDLIVALQKTHNNFITELHAKKLIDVEKSKKNLEFSVDFFVHACENFSQNYEICARKIRTMLSKEEWNEPDKTTKNARKIWSRKMFANFCLSQAFSDAKVFGANGKPFPKMSIEFKKFLQKKSSAKPSIESLQITARLKKSREINARMIGIFTEEFAEFFSVDVGELFDFTDAENFLRRVRENVASLNLEKSEKEKLLAITKLPNKNLIDSEEKIFLALKKISQNLDASTKTMFTKKSEKISQVELAISENQFLENLQESLKKDFFEIILQRGKNEILRMSDLLEYLSQDFEKFEEQLARYFPKQFKTIENTKKKLTEAKKQGDLKKIYEIEKQIIIILRQIFASEKFVYYKSDVFKASQFSETRLGNCTLQGGILPQIALEKVFLEKILGKKTKAIFSESHFSLGILSQNNKILNFDNFETLDNCNKIRVLENGKWNLIENFNISYTASVWSSLANKQQNPPAKIFCEQQAVKLIPQSPDFQTNLADHLTKNKQFQEAEKKYKKAVELTQSRNAFQLCQLAIFYEYRLIPPNLKKAIKWWEKSADILDDKKNPRNETILRFVDDPKNLLAKNREIAYKWVRWKIEQLKKKL